MLHLKILSNYLILFLGVTYLSGCGGSKNAGTTKEPPSATAKEVAGKPAPNPTNEGEPDPTSDNTNKKAAALEEALRKELIAFYSAEFLNTFQASATVAMESGEPGEREVFRAALIAEPPNRLRFRASGQGPIGELFQLLQEGETLAVFLPREDWLFVGPREQLDPSAGPLRDLPPMRLLNALLLHDDMARAAVGGPISRIDDQYFRLRGPGRFPGITAVDYVINQETMLVRRATLLGPEQFAGEKKQTADEGVGSTKNTEKDEKLVQRAVIVYLEWKEFEARHLPLEMTLAIPETGAKLTVTKPRYKLNPTLKDGVFTLPQAGETYPLWQLRFEEELEPETE